MGDREPVAQRVRESIEVQAPMQDVFAYWSNLGHFPAIKRNTQEVRIIDKGTSR